jgi:hypothetical protein
MTERAELLLGLIWAYKTITGRRNATYMLGVANKRPTSVEIPLLWPMAGDAIPAGLQEFENCFESCCGCAVVHLYTRFELLEHIATMTDLSTMMFE